MLGGGDGSHVKLNRPVEFLNSNEHECFLLDCFV